MKVLIIDDEYHSRLLLEEILGEYDDELEIIGAEFGMEGFEIIKSEKPDIVFLDVMLPIHDGKEICKQIKNESGLELISVVLVSASSMEYDQPDEARIGADAFIRKPFSTRKVIKVIEEILRKRKV
jgi:DNA-binding response OmpR family regulator